LSPGQIFQNSDSTFEILVLSLLILHHGSAFFGCAEFKIINLGVDLLIDPFLVIALLKQLLQLILLLVQGALES